MNDQPTYDDDTEAYSVEDSRNSDLDELLREFNDAPQKAPPPGQPDVGKLLKGLEPVVRYVEEDRLKKARDEEERIIGESVAYVREEDSLAEVDDELIQGFLMSRYNRDDGFRSAYDNRGSNAAEWSKALEGARSALAEKITSLPGNKVRSDVEAAKAAVNGASARVSEEEEVSVQDMQSMSDVEFRNFKLGLSR